MIIYFWNSIQVFFSPISPISTLVHYSPKYVANKFIVHLIFGIEELSHIVSSTLIFGISVQLRILAYLQNKEKTWTTLPYSLRPGKCDQSWKHIQCENIYICSFSLFEIFENKTIPTLLKVVTQSTFSVSRSVCWKFVKCSVIKTIQIAFSNLPYNHVYILTIIDFEIWSMIYELLYRK